MFPYYLFLFYSVQQANACKGRLIMAQSEGREGVQLKQVSNNSTSHIIYQRTAEKIFLFSLFIFDVHRWDCNGSVTKLHSDFPAVSGYVCIAGVHAASPPSSCNSLQWVCNDKFGAAFSLSVPSLSVCLSHSPSLFRRVYLKLCDI